MVETKVIRAKRPPVADAADAADAVARPNWFDRIDGQRMLVGFLAVAAVIYLLTATWSAPYSVDPFTNAVAARTFAAEQTAVIDAAEGLTDEQYQGSLAWFVDGEDGPASHFPPGVALWGAPFYLFETSTTPTAVTWTHQRTGEPGEAVVPIPSFAPAAVAAVVSVVAALAFLALAFGRAMDHRTTMAALVVVAFGTGAWSVAADKLWGHGPAMMCVAAGVAMASRNRFVWSGLAFGAAITIRPHLAVIVAVMGLVIAIKRREIRPLIALAIPSAAGLAALVSYNAAVFGSPSISGGYGSRLGSRFVSNGPFVVVERFFGALFDGRVGLLVTSPVFLVAFLGLWAVRRSAPDWALGAALGGFFYLAVQYRANRYTGGEGFFGYRYPLEAIVAAAPMLALAARQWIGTSETRAKIFGALAIVSIAVHASGAIAG